MSLAHDHFVDNLRQSRQMVASLLNAVACLFAGSA